VSRKASLEFLQKIAKIHSLNLQARAGRLAINASGDAPIHNHEDRVRDHRADAAQAGPAWSHVVHASADC
jgi:hypothetical protein